MQASRKAAARRCEFESCSVHHLFGPSYLLCKIPASLRILQLAVDGADQLSERAVAEHSSLMYLSLQDSPGYSHGDAN